MLSTRKPEERNFNFNHVRGLQEALGEPPWTGPGPWARGPGPSSSKHRHEIRVTGPPTPTHTIPGRAKFSLWTASGPANGQLSGWGERREPRSVGARSSKAERRPRWTGAVDQSLEDLDEGNFYGSCATMGSMREHVSLLDDLIRPCQHGRRDGDAESFRGLQVDQKLELARL